MKENLYSRCKNNDYVTGSSTYSKNHLEETIRICAYIIIINAVHFILKSREKHKLTFHHMIRNLFSVF